ncbi:PAS domain S-box protein [Chromobacterium sp. IIBBL 290-4]|uniref:PAS domain S-box protein n=1 Tax=Chromobacterium sp. IIBBL 290-4 TaxID=2953890 RepID=UPI0020B8B3E0|nr:PAS domain S-box protein [Chromobacterium sp. IIBBL 290-4]UTH73383.1 PAS domain S-box protein [Chromobacterium sp. IIBBL 290-4]
MRWNPRTRFILFAVSAYAALGLLWLLFPAPSLAGIAPAGMTSPTMLRDALFFLATVALLFVALRAVPSARAGENRPWSDPLGDGLLPFSGNRWLTYALSLALTGGMLLAANALFGEGMAQNPIAVIYLLPITLSACLGGVGPGIAATLLAGAGVDALATPHLHEAESAISAKLQLGFLLLDGVTLSLLCGWLRRALRKVEWARRLLDAVVSSTTDSIFVKDSQGRYLLANKAALAFVGKTEREVLGKDDLGIFDPISAKEVMVWDKRIMQGGKVQTTEEALTLQSGELLICQVTKGPIYDSDGFLTGVFGIARDITEQKRAEALVRDSEAALRQAQSLAGLGNWSWSFASDTHYWSPEVCRMFGVDPQAGPPSYSAMRRYFTEDSWEGLKSAVERCRLTGLGYECDAELQLPDGVVRWVTARGEARRDELGEIVGLYGTLQDITERKQMALQIKASEARLQLVVEATSDGFWDWDLRSGKVFRSSRYYEVTFTRPEDDSGDFRFFRQLVHPADLPFVLQTIEAHRRGKTARIELEFRLANQDQGIRWMQVRGRAVEWDERGAAVRLVGNLSDVTERKRIDEDLRLVLNEAGDAIWVTDPEGRYIFANPAACRLTGHALDELRQMRIQDLVAPESLAALPGHLEKLNNEQFIRSTWPLRLKAGGSITIDLTTGKLKDGRYMAFGRDQTEQRKAEQALRQREQQLARVIDGSDQGFWDWNLQTGSFQVSPRWEGMLGYAAGEMHVTAENWYDHIHPEDRGTARESIRRNLSGETPSHEVEIRCRTRGGDWRWILSRGRVVERGEDGEPLIMSGTHTDITERKVLEQTQKEAAVVFDSSYEGILIVSPDGVITKVNKAFTRITGYSMDEVLGQKPSILSSDHNPAAFYDEMWGSIQGRDFWSGELWNRRKNGELYAELLSVSVVRDAAGQVLHYIGIFSDITQLKQHEAELDRVANFDALTGIPNRRLLSDRLRQSIVRASRSGKSCAVGFLDLDGFKEVNDHYGHAAGDQLLIAVANQLKAALRGDDTLARLGGDEFVVLLIDIGSTEECMLVLDRILDAVASPVQLGSKMVAVTASIGVSLYPQDNVDPDTLLRHADQAMYVAKNAGKNRYQLFDPEGDRKAQAHREFLEQLRAALGNGELALFYQPIVDLFNGDVISLEALVRWNHPQQGLLEPADFLPHLHGNDLEMEFGMWVVDAALRQIAHWAERGFGMSVSANVNLSCLLQPAFHDNLAASLARYPSVQPGHLEIEVQEGTAKVDMERTIAAMEQTKRLGVRFALDDFGTGYASLSYLRRLPVDTLKIDQTFVRDMLGNTEDRRIVEGVIQLASVFNIKVVAEGVETLEHGALLRHLGCRYAQGYGIARPMSADAVPGWRKSWLEGDARMGLEKATQ